MKVLSTQQQRKRGRCRGAAVLEHAALFRNIIVGSYHTISMHCAVHLFTQLQWLCCCVRCSSRQSCVITNTLFHYHFWYFIARNKLDNILMQLSSLRIFGGCIIVENNN